MPATFELTRLHVFLNHYAAGMKCAKMSVGIWEISG